MPPNLKALLKIAALLLAMIVFLPAMHGDFLWDDHTYIVANHFITAADGLKHIWLSRHLPDYWPVSYSLFWSEWRWFGLQTTGYHLISLLLHFLTTCLVWRLFLRLGSRHGFLVALLFAVHPVNTEAVAWIFQQKTLLATLLAWAAALSFTYAFTGRWRKASYLGALLLLTLSFLTKPVAILWPCLLLLYASYQQSGIRTGLLKCLPFFLVATAAGVINLIWNHLFHPLLQADGVPAGGLIERVAGLGSAFWFYGAKAVAPLNLSFVYPPWHEALWGYGAVALIVVAALVLWRLGNRTLQWCFAAYFLTLFPVLGLFDIYFMRYAPAADHWQYAALPFALLFGLELIDRGLTSFCGQLVLPRFSRWFTPGLGLLFVLLLGSISLSASRRFKNEESLWLTTLGQNPRALLAALSLGVLYGERGDAVQAKAYLQQAISLGSTWEACYDLGLMEARDGHYVEATLWYEKALAFHGRHDSLIHQSLGVVLVQLNRLPEAQQHFKEALALRPSAEK